MPSSEAGKQTWLANFVDKLKDAPKGYAAKYNIPAATITLLDNGRLWVNAMMADITAVRTASQSYTAFKDQLFGGGGPLTAPTAPVFAANPATAPTAGIFPLASSIGQQIKVALNYTLADGQDLGLEGSILATPSAIGDSPDLSKSRLSTGGHVELVWKKGGHTAIRSLVDRGDGKGEVFLAIDTEPNYVDTVLPAPGTTATYTYRAIYLMGDQEFGQWSQPFEITVRG